GSSTRSRATRAMSSASRCPCCGDSSPSSAPASRRSGGWTSVARMAFKSIGLSDDLHAYLLAHNPAPDPIVTALIEPTHSAFAGVANLQIAPEQAPFLTFLTRLVGVRTAVEVGTFTGLSALSIARGLADGGRLICFDISTEYTDVAREFWAKAGV